MLKYAKDANGFSMGYTAPSYMPNWHKTMLTHYQSVNFLKIFFLFDMASLLLLLTDGDHLDYHHHSNSLALCDTFENKAQGTF